MNTPPIIQFEGGDILANLDERTITGLLLPFNEIGQTNIGRFMVEAAGIIELPADPSVAGINTDHERSAGVGRASRIWETPQGVMATFKIADTPEGDAALLDATSPTGKRKALSAEFHATIKAGKAIAGRLWGAALVERGAFASAQVLAADTPEQPADAPQLDPAHPVVQLESIPADVTVVTPGGDTGLFTPEAAPAEANQEGGSPVTVEAAAPAVTAAPVPPALAPGAPVLATLATVASNMPTVVNPRPVELQTIFAAIASLKANPQDRDAEQVLATLTDVTMTGTDALPGSDVLRPNWVGEIESGSTYEREYIDLGNHGTDITAAGKKGFRVKRGTVSSPLDGPADIPNGGTWAGNKSAINSYNGHSEAVGSSLRRFAVGHDVAREFYDLPGGAEVVSSFLALVVEDYMYWSDQWALYDLISAPTVAPVAAKTYPTDYPAAVGMLIQGILAVKRRKADGRRDTPTFAIANELAYEQLAYAAGGAEHLPAFVSLAISTASKGTVDGTVTIVEGDNGIEDTISVTVGAKRAIDFDEVPGGPLKIDAIELAKGGIDRAVHGYLQTFTKRAEAFVTIGTADTRANSTAYGLGRLIKASSVVYRVVTAGTSGSGAPTAPAVGATVADGGATLLRLV